MHVSTGDSDKDQCPRQYFEHYNVLLISVIALLIRRDIIDIEKSHFLLTLFFPPVTPQWLFRYRHFQSLSDQLSPSPCLLSPPSSVWDSSFSLSAALSTRYP